MQRGATLVATQFNTITSENVLKWEHVHPEPGRYDFGPPDRYVEFGERNGMFIVGHTLVWHSQTPRWVFQDANGNPLGRDSLLARMREHIHTVVGRYKGRIKGWDVVNEALDEDGSLRDVSLASDHRRRLHREGVRVCARSRSRRGAVLQRLFASRTRRSETARWR